MHSYVKIICNDFYCKNAYNIIRCKAGEINISAHSHEIHLLIFSYLVRSLGEEF